MNTIIKTLNAAGQIEEKAIYSLDPLHALIAYLEQNINKNYNTWQYSKSKFINLVEEIKSKKGYIYDDGITCICAYSLN